MKIAGFKLYHAPASRSVRVKWALHEAVGDAFEVEKIALYEGAQYSPEFTALNPNHCVPVLEIRWDDGLSQVMIESAAMVAFLADAYPEKGLAPPPGASRERADYLQMIAFGSISMDMMLAQVRIHEHLLPQSERDPRMVDRYREKFPGSRAAARSPPRGDSLCLRRPVHGRRLHHRLQCVLGERLWALPGRALPALPEVAEGAPGLRGRPRGCARILSGRAGSRAHHVEVHGIGVRPPRPADQAVLHSFARST